MASFDDRQQKGLAVLQQGLSPLPKERRLTDVVPISYWTTGASGVVQSLFFGADSGRVACPTEVTFQYGRSEDGWYPIKTAHHYRTYNVASFSTASDDCST
jgi:hypothetical protein